eukprot:gene36726-47879_t
MTTDPCSHTLDESCNSVEKRILQILQNSKAAAYFKQTFDCEADSKSLLSSIRFSDHNKPANNYLASPILQNLITGICSELKQVDQKNLKVLKTSICVFILETLRSKLRNSDFKYPTIQDFFGVHVYVERFDTMPEREQDLLWQTANWMHIFFKVFPNISKYKEFKIPVKRNKGFALEVISKLVEGWDAKYVSGGGSTRETKNRAFIYETEGQQLTSEESKTGDDIGSSSSKVLQDVDDALSDCSDSWDVYLTFQTKSSASFEEEKDLSPWCIPIKSSS